MLPPRAIKRSNCRIQQSFYFFMALPNYSKCSRKLAQNYFLSNNLLLSKNICNKVNLKPFTTIIFKYINNELIIIQK